MKSFRYIPVFMALLLGITIPQRTDCSSGQIYQNICAVMTGATLGGVLLGGGFVIGKIGKEVIRRGFVSSIVYKVLAHITPVGKMNKPGTVQASFATIAGRDQAKEELKDIVDYLKDSSKYTEVGAKVPRGILMHGPPGTGKTSLARAIAGEASCSLISITGSGLSTAKHIQLLFMRARAFAPCIIFIDEIDSIGRYAQEQLLTEMDGFERHKELVIVIGATNFPKNLHQGLLRPGRFDRIVHVDLPNIVERKKILEFYMGTVKMASKVDIDIIAQMTSGFSGADLANLINEAAIIAVKTGKSHIDQTDLETALRNIVNGKPEKDVPLTIEERRTVAYHEAGHALIIMMLAHVCNPLHTVSIANYKNCSGFAATVPSNSIVVNKEQMFAMLAVTYGGRVAEELVLGKITTGASNDLERARSLAYDMVCVYGMSDRLGPLRLPLWFRHPSESMRQAIEKEISALLTSAYETARTCLTEHRDKLDLIANALMQQDTLTAKTIYELVGMQQPQCAKINTDNNQHQPALKQGDQLTIEMGPIAVPMIGG
jgi:cell division protease FtsH